VLLWSASPAPRTALRDAANRAVDQRQAAALIGTDWTAGLLFSRDHEPLTLLCLTSLVDPGETSAVILGRTAAELAQNSGGDEVKTREPRLVRVCRALKQARGFCARYPWKT